MLHARDDDQAVVVVAVRRVGVVAPPSPRMSQTAVLIRLRYRDERGGGGFRKVIKMRVFVAGGTGVIGRQLVPQLVAQGHQVTATTSDPKKLGSLEQLGADAVVMDGLDAMSVGAAVAQAAPDTIVHQMTAISSAHSASRISNTWTDGSPRPFG